MTEWLEVPICRHCQNVMDTRYYHFFRKEHEPLVLIAIVISTVLVLLLDIIVSILRLLSAQPVGFSILLATLVYGVHFSS
jgi:hypothetical protein